MKAARAPGLRLCLRVTPKSRSDAISAIEDGPEGLRLKIKVRAAPEKGKANAAVLALLAEAWAVSPSAVSLLLGETGRDKIAFIAGEPAVLATRLEQLRASMKEPKR
jgi:uncharacterized protein YggU (UPF0235/DUF167 family)